MERLAKAIKLAVKYREESWIHKDQRYGMHLSEAAYRAAEEVGFGIRGTLPVYLLLDNCWDEILDWTEKFE